jgi:hypothetical protein
MLHKRIKYTAYFLAAYTLSFCAKPGYPPALRYICVTPNILDKVLISLPKHIGYITGSNDTLFFNPDHTYRRRNKNDNANGTWKMQGTDSIVVSVPWHDSTFHGKYWRSGKNLYHITYFLDCAGKDTTKHYALSKYTPLDR